MRPDRERPNRERPNRDRPRRERPDRERSERGGAGRVRPEREQKAKRSDALNSLREVSHESPDVIEREIAAVEPTYAHDPLAMARLNAYRAIAEFDRTGSVSERAEGQGAARREISELEDGALRMDVARILCAKYIDRFGAEDLRRYQAHLMGKGNGFGNWREDPTLDFQVVSREGAKQTVIIFCSFRDRFICPVNVWYHGWLAPYPSNLIVLRDWERLAYLGGIDSIGSLDESIARIREHLQALGTEKVVTFGNSGGGLGALHWGLLLKAKYIFAFAPPTDVAFGATYAGPKMRSKLIDFKDNWPDMNELFQKNPGTEAEIFFGENNRYDREQAKILEGLPNVRLSMVEGVEEHALMEQLAFDGRLQAILDRSLDS